MGELIKVFSSVAMILASVLGLVAVISVLITLPFWWLYNWLAPIYFVFLPVQYQHVDFWPFFGIVFLLKFIFSRRK